MGCYGNSVCGVSGRFIVTVAVIRGLNKKLTRLDKVRADLRIVSDKLSDTLATTTIDTAQKVGEGKVQVALLRQSSEMRLWLREKNLPKCFG